MSAVVFAMSSSNLRIRLKFESTPLAQKCWFIFDSEKCKLVSDIRHLIASRFSLKNSNGIQVCTRTSVATPEFTHTLYRFCRGYGVGRIVIVQKLNNFYYLGDNFDDIANSV